MKADTVDLSAIFGKPVHYVVPLYQRPYVWTRDLQWEPLWQDVREVADRQLDDTPANDAIPHFLGAVVLEQALVGSGMIDARSVIDGQQRLTTLQLLIAAGRSLAVERGLDGPRQMFEKLLFNESFLVKRDGDQFKVLPTQRDQPAFQEAIGDGVVASSGSHRMHEAYRFFRSSILDWAGEGGDPGVFGRRLEGLSTAVWKRLVVVTIDLDPGDNAQIIFETLNARGTPLLAADLVKNHLFQTATIQGTNVDALYEQHWKVLDTDWWREEIQQGRLKRPRLDTFINHWLAMVGDREVVSHQLFPEFKRYLATGHKLAADVLADLERYGRVYETFEKEPGSSELGQFLYRLNTLEVTTAYPALLWLLGPEGLTDPAERRIALRAIESWLVRRMLARQTTKNYNVVFLALLKRVRDAAKERGRTALGQDVVDFLARLTGESQFWPRAAEVSASLRTLPAYTVLPRGRLRMVLEALEQAMYTTFSEKVVLPTDLTIEHVLPQEWSANWPLPEGADQFQGRLDRDAAKHRLGNLTLITGKLNSSASNAGWIAKRASLRELSVMRISTDIRNAETWNEAAIAERGERLAAVAVGLWQRPDDEAQASAATEVTPGDSAPGSSLEGPPDSEDPAAFASPLAIADEIGVGGELRRIIEVTRELGLYPRPDRNSVMVSPPADKRVYLFTVWPQWAEGGSFKLWKSPAAFAKWLPGVTLEAVHAALGRSEDPGVLLAHDTEGLLEALRRLLPAGALGQSAKERRDALGRLGIERLDRIPDDVLRLVELRAGGAPEPALRFAGGALGFDGAFLRAQQSKGDPWYFQVRHPRFSQVVAYAHPRPGEVRIEYRLPEAHDTYGIATARDNFYGVVMTARDGEGLEIALRLLGDALDRVETVPQKTSTRGPIDESDLFAALGTACSAEGVAAIRVLFDWVGRHGGSFAWGFGDQYPSTTAWFNVEGQWVAVWSCYARSTNPTWDVNFEYLRRKGVSTERMAGLAGSLRQLEGVTPRLAGLEERDYLRRPSLSIDGVVANPGAVQRILSALSELVDEA